MIGKLIAAIWILLFVVAVVISAWGFIDALFRSVVSICKNYRTIFYKLVDFIVYLPKLILFGICGAGVWFLSVAYLGFIVFAPMYYLLFTAGAYANGDYAIAISMTIASPVLAHFHMKYFNIASFRTKRYGYWN